MCYYRQGVREDLSEEVTFGCSGRMRRSRVQQGSMQREQHVQRSRGWNTLRNSKEATVAGTEQGGG